MERIFLLKGLDCPNCSAKIEKEVGDLENVNSSSVNLMKQTLTIQTETSTIQSLSRLRRLYTAMNRMLKYQNKRQIHLLLQIRKRKHRYIVMMIKSLQYV